MKHTPVAGSRDIEQETVLAVAGGEVGGRSVQQQRRALAPRVVLHVLVPFVFCVCGVVVVVWCVVVYFYYLVFRY